MGVKGLWKLLDGTGRPVDLDSLEGKVLAVDISVWLNMAVKGMRDYHGHASQTAHLVSLFNRICKLLYHGIKPVFVFDGKAPDLKQKTLRERRDRKMENVRESKKASEKILQNFLKRQLLDEISNSAPKKRLEISEEKGTGDLSHKPVTTRNQKQEEDIYDLPPLSTNLNHSDDSELEEELSMRAELQREFHDNVTYNEFQNILGMNIESTDFNSLPSDVQYELLQDLHEVRKRQRTRIETMPEESNSFSNYQIKGLLAKRKITKKMESVENKMSQENVEASRNFFGLESMEHDTVVARQLVSDSKSHFIWLRKSSDVRNRGQNEEQTDKDNNKVAAANPQEPKVLLPENLSAPVASKKRVSPKEAIADSLHRPGQFDNVKNPKMNIGSEISRKATGELTKIDLSDDGQDYEEVVATVVKTVDSKRSVPSDFAVKSTAPPFRKTETCRSVVSESVSNKQSDLKLLVPSSSATNDPDLSPSPRTSQTSDQLSEKFFSQNRAHSQIHENIIKDRTSDIGFETEEILPAVQPATVTPDQEVSDEKSSSDSGEDFVDVLEEIHSEKVQTAKSNISDRTAKVSSSVISHEDSDQRDENPWEGLDVGDVRKYAEDIDQQSKELRKLMQDRDRAAREVSQSAQTECQDLLKLFGLPYVVSPQEAEAQCAELELIGLTDGTITDDSDIWLFGGKYVIKDMFGSRKDPVAYHVSDIETQLGLTRDRFICIALCSGSDYTRGIHGVGPVTAMEILKEFHGEGITGLIKLKQWWDDTVTSTKQSLPTETKIKSQIRRVNLRKDFPSETVYNAYMRPIVNTENQKFEWGFPDLDELRIFATDVMGWTRLKVDEILLPVIKRQGQRRSAQSKITNYFQTSFHPMEKKRSKRVQRAALVLTGKHDLRKSSLSVNRQRQKRVTVKKGNQLNEIKLSESSSSGDE